MNRVVQIAMAEAGETADSIARQVGVDPKTVARWVSQDRIPQIRHRAQIAEILKRDVLDLWPDAHRRKEPSWFKPWTELERDAIGLRWFESAVLPGLLQTEEYARAVLGSGPLGAAVENHIASRLQRQKAVFDRPKRPLSVFVIDEAALRRGAAEIMQPQLDHLITMAEQPNIMVHVLPLAAGLHPGQAGPFVIATPPEGGDVGYVDDQAAGRITKDVTPLWAVWDIVRSVALPRDQTIEFLRARSWLT